MRKSRLQTNVRKAAVAVGFSILFISMYLSFDGFDGSVSGVNSEYETLGVVIGLVFAVAVSLLQFIFTSDYKGLNPTLKFIGIMSYVYSIYTNMLGAQNLLGMDGAMAVITAAFADIAAEPMVSWGLGEALVGDLIGNLWKSVGSPDEESANTRKKDKKNNQKAYPSSIPRNENRPSPRHQSPQPRPSFSTRPEPSSAFLEAMESLKQSSEPVYHNMRQQDER